MSQIVTVLLQVLQQKNKDYLKIKTAQTAHHLKFFFTAKSIQSPDMILKKENISHVQTDMWERVSVPECPSVSVP